MDIEQARHILNAHRPGRDDAEDRALFEEALAQTERDPELAEWFAEQSRLDDLMRDALRNVEPPADLLAAILASAKTSREGEAPAEPAFSVVSEESTARQEPRPPNENPGLPVGATRRQNPWITPTWLALAATVALAAGVGFLVMPRGGPRVPLAEVDAAIPQMTRAHEHPFATDDGDIGKIRAWLASNHGATGFDVPAGLRGIHGMGCEVASVNGAKVSIVCFEMPGGGAAHLYVMDRSALRNPPPADHAEIQRRDGIAMASWSDARHSYILAMAGSDNAVRALL
jgi:hypothetical protein